MELVANAREVASIGERRGRAIESELPALVKSRESREELAAKEGGEHAHGEEEAGAGGDPSLAVGREAAAGHDAVHVRMEAQVARPGVEHAGDPELGAEPSRVTSELEEGVCGGSKERVEERLAVGQDEASELGR